MSTLRSPLSNKVPQVVLLFWVVKVLSTTVGETAADFLSTHLGLGLTTTFGLMAALLTVVLVVQIRSRRHVPTVYWLAVVLISIVGTLISDDLVADAGISLWVTTFVFGTCLAATFTAWWHSEGTLSIQTIVTPRREEFYWLAVLVAFALGTSAGDLVSKGLKLAYPSALAIFGSLIALVAVAFWEGGLNAVLGFWTVYVLTRPFGASLGDLLAASRIDGGLRLGASGASAIFLVVILGVVGWFTVRERRSISSPG